MHAVLSVVESNMFCSAMADGLCGLLSAQELTRLGIYIYVWRKGLLISGFCSVRFLFVLADHALISLCNSII